MTDYSNPEHWAAVFVSLVVFSLLIRQVWWIIKGKPNHDFEAIKDLLFKLLFPARWKQAELKRLAWEIDKLERECKIGPYSVAAQTLKEIERLQTQAEREQKRTQGRGLTWVTDDQGRYSHMDPEELALRIETARSLTLGDGLKAPCQLGMTSHVVTLAGTCVICGQDPHAVDEVTGAAVCFVCGRSDGSIEDHVHGLCDVCGMEDDHTHEPSYREFKPRPKRDYEY